MLYKHSIDDQLDPIYNKDEGWRLVVPLEYRDQVLWDGHNEPFSGHLGVEEIHVRFAREFYWPDIYRDIRQYVLHCDESQNYKAVQTGPQGLMTGRILVKPWIFVGADLMHFPRSKSRNKY